MKIDNNRDLSHDSTMCLPSVADVMYFPESKEELTAIIMELRDGGKKYHIVSAGSNIVFAERVKTPLINLMEVDKSISFLDEGAVRVGCSVRVQKLIRDLQKHGLGGIEYLFSVPTSIGGAVYMNAGRGKDLGLAISDYLEEVEYYSPSEKSFCVYKKRDGDYSYRMSPFQGTDRIIVSATFRFKKQSSEETDRLIKERMDHSKKFLSSDKPSCGTVFCEGNRVLYRLLMGKRCGGAMYSKKTPDWISNMGNATATDVMNLIDKGIKWHRWIGSKCRLEIRYLE